MPSGEYVQCSTQPLDGVGGGLVEEEEDEEENEEETGENRVTKLASSSEEWVVMRSEAGGRSSEFGMDRLDSDAIVRRSSENAAADAVGAVESAEKFAGKAVRLGSTEGMIGLES